MPSLETLPIHSVGVDESSIYYTSYMKQVNKFDSTAFFLSSPGNKRADGSRRDEHLPRASDPRGAGELLCSQSY